jgi:hypothetical protein
VALPLLEPLQALTRRHASRARVQALPVEVLPRLALDAALLLLTLRVLQPLLVAPLAL